MRPMIGGYEYAFAGVGGMPNPAFMFVPGESGSVELYANNPDHYANSHHFKLNLKNISIVVTSNDFKR